MSALDVEEGEAVAVREELLEMLQEPGLVAALTATALSSLAMSCGEPSFGAAAAALVACLLVPRLLRCFGGFGAWMATWAWLSEAL